MSPCAADRPSGRGQALVELALITPLLLFLFMGMVDIGRLLFASVAIEEAVQEGALYAAFEPSPAPSLEEAVSARVTSSSGASEVAGSTVTVVCDDPEPGTITVTAQYDLPLLTPLIREMLGGATLSLEASVTAPDLRGTC